MDIENWSVSPATELDFEAIATLSATGELVHRHLDWWAATVWLNIPTFLVIRQDKKIIAAMACPEYPANVSWLRFLGISRTKFVLPAWKVLWREFQKIYQQTPIKFMHAIPLDVRFRSVLAQSGGEVINSVVNLSRSSIRLADRKRVPLVNIRDMDQDELPLIAELDSHCFENIWQNTFDELVTAFTNAYSATVAEYENEVVGYQLTTRSQSGCHLARLAVLPGYQGRGIGKMILTQLITTLMNREIDYLSVNTQEDNFASLALYKKTGFTYTGMKYPVYRLPFWDDV